MGTTIDWAVLTTEMHAYALCGMYAFDFRLANFFLKCNVFRTPSYVPL
jgi:hypothetical protein